MTLFAAKNWKIVFLFTLAGLLLLLAGAVMGRYDRWPMNKLVSFAVSIKKDVTIKFVGEEKFVADALADNYKTTTLPTTATARVIDSSRLPLSLTSFSLVGTGSFATNDELVRGAITRIGDSLFLMDKLGNIFQFRENSLRRMDYGIFPNGIHQAILSSNLNSGRQLPLTAVRTLYIAYDRSSSRIFISQQRYDSTSKHVRFNISSINIDPETFSKTSNWQTIFESEDIPDDASFRGATGGRLLVAGNLLYFSIGDYNFGQIPKRQAELVAQNLDSSFGKIYQYDLTSGKTRVTSIGHRNPQGLAIDSEGRLLNTEHGPEGGDEINIVVDGKNYGWPYETYGTDYGTFGWPIPFKAPNITFSEPLFSWIPSIAVSPVIRVTAFDQQWDGDLLIGSLKAQSLFRLKIRENRVVFSEPIWIGHRIRDIVEMSDHIVLMTDDPSLIFLRVDRARFLSNSKMQKNVELTPALAKCLNCHHFGETNSSHLAPTLANIIGKKIASDGFLGYSDALKSKKGTWTTESLKDFIINPNRFASGTAMPSLNLSDAQATEVVSALGSIKSK